MTITDKAMAATERIPVLLTAAEKRQIAKRSEAAGLSMGEFLRQAAASFTPSDDEAALASLIDQVNKSTARASASIDKMLASVAASNKKIAAMERAAAKRSERKVA